MTAEVPANLRRDDIMRVLSRADETARARGDDLAAQQTSLLPQLEFLWTDECPVTYLPVIAVMLVARSIRERAELDVLDIQRRSGPRGYAASSIASHLIKFVTQVGIDLRTTSSQVMNSQPFTYKKRVTPNMAGDRSKAAYARFYALAEHIEQLSSEEAEDLLALIFHLRRDQSTQGTGIVVVAGDRQTLESILEATAAFVTENSEAGKVGQAFAAALFDVLFPANQVRMGNNNDPSATLPGDVQVGTEGSFWLWAEVKQKAVVSSEVQAFVDRVKAVGGDRARYFALGNALYPQNIDVAQLRKKAMKDGIELTVYSAPEEALRDLMSNAPGSSGMQADAVVNRMAQRLREAKVTSALEAKWDETLSKWTK